MNPKTKGTAWILNSAVFFATYGVWSHLMGHDFGEFSQAWTRGLILLVFVVLVGKWKKLFEPMPKKDWPWFLVIASIGLNQAPYYYGFQHLGVGTATLLFYAALVIGGYLIGKLVFNETLTRTKLTSLVIGLAGLGVIYRLSLTPAQIWPATLTIIAGLMGAISAVLPKKLSGQYHEFQIMAGYLTVMLVANGLIAYLVKDSLPPISAHSAWLAAAAYAAALLIANFSVIEGFKYLEASIGSLIGMAEIIFGILFGFLFFGEILSATTFLGGALIVLAAALPNLKLPPSLWESRGPKQNNK